MKISVIVNTSLLSKVFLTSGFSFCFGFGMELRNTINVLYALDEFSNVIASDRVHRGACTDIRVRHNSRVSSSSSRRYSVAGIFVVFALNFDVLEHINASVNKVFLGEHSFEDGLTVSYINSM
jgi:hypothetical protein